MPTLNKKDPDPVREYLSSVYAIKLETERLTRRIEALEARCEKMTANLEGLSAKGVDEGPERLWIILAEERKREARKLEELFTRLHEVEEFLNLIEDELCKAVLKLRYLEFQTWPGIQRRLHDINIDYSERQLCRLYNKAMSEARLIWDRLYNA